MDIKATLINEYGKPAVGRIVEYIGDRPDRFKVLMNLFYGEDKRLSQRAAWPMSNIGLKQPQLVKPYLKRMVEQLNEDTHVAVKRNILRVIQTYNLPEDLAGEAFEYAFNLMLSPKEAVAIRAFSITTVANICSRYPELKQEVTQAIDMIMEDAERPAILVRCRDARKVLSNIN